MIDVTSETEGHSETSLRPSQEMKTNMYSGKPTEKGPIKGILKTDKTKTEKEMSTEQNILKIYREKNRLLMEANTEKDRRLERLEKELNDHTIQHKEGIYWLRMQLDTIRREKDAADERIDELLLELRRLTSNQPPRKVSLDPTISDSVGNGDETENLVSKLESRIEKYESSFIGMENQMAIIKASSGEVINTLKEEIANLMEDRTRSELELLNQLTELDNQNRRNQLEHALEIHNKDETIETLRHLETCSITAKEQQASSLSTLLYDGSGSTEDTKGSIFGGGAPSLDRMSDLPIGNLEYSDQKPSTSSLLIHSLGEEKAELQRKLDEANKELEKFRTGLVDKKLEELKSGMNVKARAESFHEDLENSQLQLKMSDDIESVQRIPEEKQVLEEKPIIYYSIEKVKTMLESADTAVSKVKSMIKNLKTGGVSENKKDKKKLFSVLESATLIHEEVKLSVMLIELKLRNEFECLKKNGMYHSQVTPNIHELINDMEQIQNDAFIYLGKAGSRFSRQMDELEKRIVSREPNLDQLIEKNSDKRKKNHDSKSSKKSDTPVVDELISSCKANRDSKYGSQVEGGGLTINRDVMYLLEKELIQFAERLLAKNQKIVLLKEQIEKHRIRESNLRKELRASIRLNVGMTHSVTKASKDVSSKPIEFVNQSIPREIHTTIDDRPMTPIGESHRSLLSADPAFSKIKLAEEGDKRKRGASDDSLDGGTNPLTQNNPNPNTPVSRRDSIGFVPSPTQESEKPLSNSTGESESSDAVKRRLQPTSREIKKLVFLPPCFFSDVPK